MVCYSDDYNLMNCYKANTHYSSTVLKLGSYNRYLVHMKGTLVSKLHYCTC